MDYCIALCFKLLSFERFIFNNKFLLDVISLDVNFGSIKMQKSRLLSSVMLSYYELLNKN